MRSWTNILDSNMLVHMIITLSHVCWPFFCPFINTSPGGLFSFEQLLKLVPVPIPGRMGHHKMRLSFLFCAAEAQVCGPPWKEIIQEKLCLLNSGVV